MELFDALGLNGKILLAQLINFAVLVWVIWKFAYGPIVKTLNDRQKKIEKGIRNAAEAKDKLAEMEKREKQVLDKARQEAQEIIKKAESVAEESKQEIVQVAHEEASKILAEAKKKIEQEGQQMMSEIKKDLAELVLAATEKVVGEKMDLAEDKKMVEKIVSEIK